MLDELKDLSVLDQIDEQTPSDLAGHLILDNYGTHKHSKAERWLNRHSRFHFDFIPTSSSWRRR